MTRFWRDGHYRTSSTGTVSWVDGHWVDRTDWDRIGGYRRIFDQAPVERQHGARQQIARTSVRNPSREAPFSFTIPNAICPVCGAKVFFYANEHGSRVFFDELGPPWPKHPCTISDDMSLGGGWTSSSWLTEAEIGSFLSRPFEERLLGWRPIEVLRTKVTKRAFLQAEYIDEVSRPSFSGWLVDARRPTTGSIAFIRDGTIWFVDYESLEPTLSQFDFLIPSPGNKKRRRRRKKR